MSSNPSPVSHINSSISKTRKLIYLLWLHLSFWGELVFESKKRRMERKPWIACFKKLKNLLELLENGHYRGFFELEITAKTSRKSYCSFRLEILCYFQFFSMGPVFWWPRKTWNSVQKTRSHWSTFAHLIDIQWFHKLTCLNSSPSRSISTLALIWFGAASQWTPLTLIAASDTLTTSRKNVPHVAGFIRVLTCTGYNSPPTNRLIQASSQLNDSSLTIAPWRIQTMMKLQRTRQGFTKREELAIQIWRKSRKVRSFEEKTRSLEGVKSVGPMGK